MQFHSQKLTYTLKYREGESLVAHFLELQRLQAELREMGESIDDSELAMTALGSLKHAKYKPLITSLDVAGEKILTFERVKALYNNPSST